MNTMTAVAGDDRLTGPPRIAEGPRARRVHRLHQVANTAFVIAAVAAQAIVHEQALRVVRLVDEDLRERGAMRARLPLREFLLVAALAAIHDGDDVDALQTNLLGDVA